MAVVGLGTIGPVHARWCAEVPGSSLVAVCDANAARAEEVAARYGAEALTDYASLVARSDVDAIVIATPTYLHAPMALAAIDAGKHVAIEKPLARSVREGAEVVEAARRRGVTAQYFENLCFAPTYAMARQLVSEGAVGEPFFVRCTENAGGGASMGLGVYEPEEGPPTPGGQDGEPLGAWYRDPARSGGGMLLSTGCHAIAYIYHLLGRPAVERVAAETLRWGPSQSDLEDAGYVTIRFSGNRVGFVDSSAINALGTFDDRAEIYGTEGSILLDLYRSTPIRVFSQRGYGSIGSSLFGRIPGASRNWSFPIADEEWSLGYYNELRSFLAAIRTSSPPEVTLEDGLVTLQIIEAAYEAARSGVAQGVEASAARSDVRTGSGAGDDDRGGAR